MNDAPKSPARLNTDRIVSLSAMAVGVASLVITIYQTSLTRQAQNAAVLPYVMLSIHSNTEGAYFVLTNTGVGPAMIDDVLVRFQGREQPGDAYDFFIAQRPDRNIGALSLDRIMKGRLIPAGAQIQMLGMGGAERATMLSDMLRLFEIAEVPRSWLVSTGAEGRDKAVLEVSYSSIYGDRWCTRSSQLIPERY